MSALDAIETMLTEAGEPRHYREITRLIMGRALWATDGKTPEATINALLSVDVKKKGSHSRFQRTGKGLFALRAWGLPELAIGKEEAHAASESDSGPRAPREPKTLSFTDAAERVLTQFGGRKPMHYVAITEQASESGLIATTGKTPEATMYAAILSEIRRKERRGEQPRFANHGKGFVGLTQWMAKGLAFQIDNHNKTVRRELHKRIRQMDPTEFEALASQLLVALGFEDVSVTSRASDGGIDVRGTLVVGDVIRTRMAVQVKRWKPNVLAPTVQQVRGSLGAHEQGLIITTSNFSKGARDEAERPDATPVALMDGEQLVKLLVENDLGVQRTAYELLELGAPDDGSADLSSLDPTPNSDTDWPDSGPPARTAKRRRGETGFPPKREIEAALLRAIIARGGSVVIRGDGQAVEDELADLFALTDEQRRLTVPSGTNAWHKSIMWARQALVGSGDLDGSQRGVWTATEKGRRRAVTEHAVPRS